jgi:hypothetical protein
MTAILQGAASPLDKGCAPRAARQWPARILGLIRCD